jgi:hypothetical protein
VIVSTTVSLDGVMENPSWTMPIWNDEHAAFAKEQQSASDSPFLR